MNVVFSPTILFIDEAEWNDDALRANFIENLESAISYVSENNHNLYWSDNIEEALWVTNNSDLLPWCTPERFRLWGLMQEGMRKVSINSYTKLCSITPDIKHKEFCNEMLDLTLQLFHYMICENIGFEFIVDEANDISFEIYCECHNIRYKPNVKAIAHLNDIDLSTYTEENWDSIISNKDLLNDIVQKYINEYFCGKKKLYTISVTQSFLKDIQDVDDKYETILYKIAKRSTVYQKEAVNDKGLKDEPIKGTKKNQSIRSFRINGECRIQYTYKSDGIIELRTYSGSGEHDKNLSHTRKK